MFDEFILFNLQDFSTSAAGGGLVGWGGWWWVVVGPPHLEFIPTIIGRLPRFFAVEKLPQINLITMT